MGIGELLDRIRDQYVAQFEAAVHELKEQHEVHVVSESALCNQDGDVVTSGELGLPLRSDLFIIKGDKVVERVRVDSKTLLSFQPISFDWSDRLTVHLAPFQWDNVDFRIPTKTNPPDWSHLLTWFREWFREEVDGEGEPLGVVHFLSDPKSALDGTLFNTDLGTAPVEAFEALLDAIGAMGISEVFIGKVDFG